MQPYLEPQTEFFDRAAVPPEIDPGTARLVRAAVSARDPRRLRVAWQVLAARAGLARAMRPDWC